MTNNDPNEIIVTGAMFFWLSSATGIIDLTTPEIDGMPANVLEFGLDFMQSRYRVTIERVKND